MKRHAVVFALTLIGFISYPMEALAKVGDPPPLIDGTVTYRSHANEVEAIDTATGKQLWKTKVYDTIRPASLDPSLEGDVQWNIIWSLRLKEGQLEVKNKAGGVFLLDKKTGKTISPSVIGKID